MKFMPNRPKIFLILTGGFHSIGIWRRQSTARHQGLTGIALKQQLLFIVLLTPFLALAESTTFLLAKELLTEKSHTLSAVEFRRFAMETDQRSEQATAYLFSGYAYLQAKEIQAASEMIDRAEDTDEISKYQNERTLLSAEAARLEGDQDTALYFYDVLAEDSKKEEYQTFARRRAAVIHLASGNPSLTRQQLESSPSDESLSLQALETYTAGKNKSPKLGGFLGLIPGAGYWYSGEIANGLRSLILNSLFIYGMVNTAEKDQWGAFGIITFFEVTWYSGSIYGGIDAAQRYNQERLHTALHEIEGDLSYRPESDITIPVFKLNIQF